MAQQFANFVKCLSKKVNNLLFYNVIIIFIKIALENFAFRLINILIFNNYLK